MARNIFLIIQYLATLLSLNTTQLESIRHERIYIFEQTSPASLRDALRAWEGEAETVVIHTAGNGAGGLSSFAQSFVPHSSEIQAVQLRLTPGHATGWVRVELAGDNKGVPGLILARTWLRMDRNVMFLHNEHLTIPLRSPAVDPEGTYWITVVEYRDRGFKHYTVLNLVGSLTDTYAEGKFILPSGSAQPNIADAGFRIVARAPVVPGLEDVSELMKGALPGQPCQTISWSQAFEECNRLGPQAPHP